MRVIAGLVDTYIVLMNISYVTRVPFPLDRVLAQYFDLEHIETVHPTTLGQYRLLEVVGNSIIFEQIWPKWLGIHLRTTITQSWYPPNQIRFDFMKGFLRGVSVLTQLQACDEETIIKDIYHVPLVPKWRLLRPPLAALVKRGVDRVWKEDLAVELCHGGWPGIPGHEEQVETKSELNRVPSSEAQMRWVRVAEDEDLHSTKPVTIEVDGQSVMLWKDKDGIRAIDSRCPHTDGPLALGQFSDTHVTCPWHNAKFRLNDGRVCRGPATQDLAVFPVKLAGKAILIQISRNE